MSAWKDLERRVCAQLGGRRGGPVGAAVSDCVNVPFAVEVKRVRRYQLRRSQLEQAWRQSRDEGKPWMLVMGEHNDRHPIVICDFAWLVQVLRDAGAIPRVEDAA